MFTVVKLRFFANTCGTIARAPFEIPARVKTDPILNNYLTQTMENNARSGVKRVQAEMPCIFIFPRSKYRLRTALTGRVKKDNDKIDASVSRTALSIWPRFVRRFFCGKTFGFRPQTIPSVTCQQKERECRCARFC